jgi:hypothetical protein
LTVSANVKEKVMILVLFKSPHNALETKIPESVPKELIFCPLVITKIMARRNWKSVILYFILFVRCTMMSFDNVRSHELDASRSKMSVCALELIIHITSELIAFVLLYLICHWKRKYTIIFTLVLLSFNALEPID